MKTDFTGSIFGRAGIYGRFTLASVLCLILAADSLRAGDPIVVGGEPGAASKRDVADFTSLARQEAIFPLLVTTSSRSKRSLRQNLKEPGLLAVPTDTQAAPPRSTSHRRALSRSQPVSLASVSAAAAPPPPPPGPPPLPSPPTSASFQALLDDGSLFEPDAQGAVGPNHLMVTLNTQVRVQDRNGGVISTVSLQNFWSMPGVSNAFDPRVIYDPYGQRWITTAAADYDGRNPGILVAVSKTSDPTGLWNRYFIDVDTTTNAFAVAPTVGFNKDWIVVQANMFLKSTYDFVGSYIYVLDKTNHYAGGAGLRTRFALDDVGTTQVPAVTYDNTLDTVYLLKDWNGYASDSKGYLRLFSISGPVGAPTLTYGAFVESLDTWDSDTPGYGDFAPQLGNTNKIYTGDSRIQNLVYRNGTLWATHTVYFSGEPASAVQWWEVTPSGIPFQQGIIEDLTGTNFFAYPSIAVNRYDDVLISYCKFSKNQYPSATYGFRDNNDSLETLRSEAVLKAGEAPYYRNHDGVNRWGDLSAATVDPLNDADFWAIQEYAATPVGGSSRWGTWWGRIAPPNDLAITMSGSPGTVTAGSPVTYTMTVTNKSTIISSGVLVTDTLPVDAVYVSATPSVGSCGFASGIVTCDLGTLNPTDKATITLVIKPGAAGQNANVAVVSSNGQDNNLADNTATVLTTVNSSADLLLLMSGSPNPPTIGNNLTYTITVTNQGPSSGTGVNVTNNLPAGVTYVSATPDQGSCTRVGNTVSCSLGAIANRSDVKIILVVTPTAGGSISNRASVTASSSDPNSANNIASLSLRANSPPTLSTVVPQTVPEDQSTAALAVTVGDGETAAASLLLSASSSNPALVPDLNLVLGGSGSARTLRATPLHDQSGTTTITLTVTDGDGATATSAFLLTVTPLNDPPTISDILDQAVDEDVKLGPVSFTVADVDNSVASLTLSAVSSNPTLVPNANIVFGGSGANRNFAVMPATNRFGSTVITVTVSDGIATASDTFTLTVNPINDPPTLSDIADQAVDEDVKAGPLNVTVGDVETAVGSLTLSGSSSNPTLVPNGNIVFGGGGANRTVTITPATNQFGSAVITVTVNDGSATTSDTFNLTVSSVNDAPTLNPPGDVSITKNAGPQTVNLSGIGSGASNENQPLTITATTDTPGLITNIVVTYTSPAAIGTLGFGVVSNAFGSGVVTVTVDDGQSQNSKFSRSFTVIVSGSNELPSISDILDQNLTEDTKLGPINFTVGDQETPAANLTVSGSSSNPALVPNASLVFGGSGASRTLTLMPATNQFGTTIITVMVSDGSGTASDTFTLTVNSVNDLPTITDILPQTIDEDGKAGPLSFVVGDVETAAASLTVAGSSDNQALVPNANIVFGGSGASRTVTVTPATNQFGTTIITVTVNDGSGSSSDTFTLTVNPINDPPTISDIIDQTVSAGGNTGPLAFTVGDPETSAGSLTLAGSSSNPALVPNGSIVFGGSGASRTVTVTPLAGQSGVTTITVTVTDGNGASKSDTFGLTVQAVNTPPTIDAIANRTIDEDAPTVVPVTIGDKETPAGSLVLSASSSNEELVGPDGLVLAGVGANRTLTITPLLNQFGSTTITLLVTDGVNPVSTSFELTVRSLNDLPSISDIADQTIAVGGKAGPISFTVGDVETAAASLTLSGASSNPALVPVGNIVFGGSGGNRTITVTPLAGQSGTATITVTVTDAGNSSRSDTFSLTVGGAANPPTLSLLKSGDNVVISWESTATGYLLQSSPALSPNAAWSKVAQQPVIVGGRFQVILAIEPGNRFFRLSKP